MASRSAFKINFDCFRKAFVQLVIQVKIFDYVNYHTGLQSIEYRIFSIEYVALNIEYIGNVLEAIYQIKFSD